MCSSDLPVQIRVFAPALITTQALSPGAGLSDSDYRIEEIELTREPPGILGDTSSVENQILVRALPAGTPLRRDHFRPRPVIVPGEQIKLVFLGNGFSISSFGKALHAGLEGQAVRVQIESGKVLSGIARASKTVEIRF